MEAIRRAADLLRGRGSVVVLTGAGVSAESAVPTFRDAMTGLWARYDAERLATPGAFGRDPALVSRWYDERRQRVLGCEPNAAHLALAEWQRSCSERGVGFTLLTQNVDRLHQRAGSEDVVELHGSLLVWRCTKSGRERTDLPAPLPHYPMPSEAGGIYRPGVVWFGEALPEAALARARAALASCDAVVSIGTSAVVQPAASFVLVARAHGAAAVEVNREPTPISGAVDVSVQGLAGEIVPELVRLLQEP
ncbi:MAG TPA: NAD-dependent deacylase [Phycisphaerales bacterium]|nr:NAD-dependent deacylase [Phycisphaerales bacterium]